MIALAIPRIDHPTPLFRRKLFNGLAQVLVQSAGHRGEIRIRSHAAGLDEAHLVI